MEKISSDYWHKIEDGRVVCDLCPRQCHLRDGKRGACFVRQAESGKMVFTAYGLTSGFAVDPIEKKPLNHFYPGSSVYSFGSIGCNLACKFCQNWGVSHSRNQGLLKFHADPEQIAVAARRHGCLSVGFTYNDPVVFFEYVRDTSIACHEAGIKTIAISAGYLCDEPRRAFFKHIDAANIDLKSMQEKFYRKLCNAHLSPVLDTLLYLKHETDVWFEITTLLIPGENDSDHDIIELCQWVVDNLGYDVPIHFSAFHPTFKMRDRGYTPSQTLIRARNIALNLGIHYVYTGNISDELTESTYCPHCRNLIIRRRHYSVTKCNINKSNKCEFCHSTISGKFN